jgi:hypothetical protein
MTESPYQIQLEDLPITVEKLLFKMTDFSETDVEFNDEVGHIMSVKGKWRDRDLRNAADFTVNIRFWDLENSIQNSDPIFTGMFSINKYGAFEVPYLCELMEGYCYGLIANFIAENPIMDKNRKLFPVPKSPKSDWSKNYFDLP